MLKNFVEETAVDPGTDATINLGGATAGRVSWAGSGFSSGASVFYVVTDGTVGEWGMGTFTAGSPNTVSRDTVLGNTAGTTSRLNFTGTCRVYNALPSERALYINGSTLSLPGDLIISKANPVIRVDKNYSGQTSSVVGLRAGAYRWNVELGNAGPEYGSNQGSHFVVSRYDDSGNYLDSPIYVDRQTGNVQLSNGAATVSIAGAIGVNGTSYFAGNITTGGYARLTVGTGGITTTGAAHADGNISTDGMLTSGSAGIFTLGNIGTGTTGSLSVGTGGLNVNGGITGTANIAISGNYFGGTGSALTMGTGGIYTTGTITTHAAGAGYATLYSGNSTACGYLGLFTADGSRRGYMGFNSGANQLMLAAEAGWGWQIAGTTQFLNGVNVDSGLLALRSSGIRCIYFKNSVDYEQAAFWNDTSGAQNLRVNSHTTIFNTDGSVSLSPVASQAAISNTTGSLKLINTGGTGDGNVTAIDFECAGGYWGTKLALRHDGVIGFGGHSTQPWRWYLNTASGDVVAAGNVTAYSDPRLKDDVEPIEDALGIIEQLDGVRFTWNARSKLIGKPGARSIGVLADQVFAVLPEIVTDSIEDPETGESYSTVAYDKIVPVLIQAVKELSARVRELEATK